MYFSAHNRAKIIRRNDTGVIYDAQLIISSNNTPEQNENIRDLPTEVLLT